MDNFKYDTSACYNLQELGTLHDRWLKKIWKRRSGIIRDDHVTRRSEKSCKSKRQGYIFFGTSDQPSEEIMLPQNARLKDIKKTIQLSYRIRRSWRYFFLTWCKELNREIKHEVVSDYEMIPTYLNMIFLYIE